MIKTLLKKKIIKISLIGFMLCILIFVSIILVQNIQKIMQENAMVDSVYKAASSKYDKNKISEYEEKIEKAISKYKKSKINSDKAINERLLDTAEKVIIEKRPEGARVILEKCSDKKGLKKKKEAVIYNLAKAYSNKKDYLNAYEFFGECENVSDAKKQKSEAAYKYAEVMYKDGDYEEAYIYYEKSQKDGLEKKIKEAKYQYIVNNVLEDIGVRLNKYLDDDDYDLVEELGDYKYSKEILLWSDINKKSLDYKSSDVETVERRLKWRLKNPFSYIRGNKIATAQFKKGYRKGYGTIKIIIALKYYAKNSFGALIGDYHVDSVEHVIYLNGIKYKKAKKIASMSAWEIADKAKKIK